MKIVSPNNTQKKNRFGFNRRGIRVFFSWTLFLFSLLLIQGRAEALTPSFSINTFEPTVDDSAFFTVYGSPTMLKRNYHLGLYLDYAHHPYEFGNQDFNRVEGVVDHLLSANILGSYAVFDWFSTGLVLPVHLYEGIRTPSLNIDESNFALGDVKLVFKFRALDREKHHVGVALVPFVSFPSSTNSTKFLGNGGFTGGLKIVLDGRIKDRVDIALNVGYLTRDRVIDVSGNDLDDQFLAGLGISGDILKNKLKMIGEFQAATVAKDFFQKRRTTPAEARIGFRYTIAREHDINVGGGLGTSNGIGSPDYRAFIGYTYTRRPLADIKEPPPEISDISIGDELTLQDKIYFEFDSDKIRDISKPTLDKIAAFIKAHPEITKVKIDGHTCDLGRDEYNQRLSEKRANSVAAYLKNQGIEANRIGTVTGYGENNPLVPNTDEANREQNRRVQIFVEDMDRSLAQPATEK